MAINRYAHILGNIVHNVVESYDIPSTQPGFWVLCNNTVSVGDTYNEGVFTKPQPLARTQITQLAFLNRFTDAEAITIDLASIGATTQAASIRRYLNKVNAARFIDLSRPDTVSGVQALETAGLIGPGRADVILNTPPTSQELA